MKKLLRKTVGLVMLFGLCLWFSPTLRSKIITPVDDSDIIATAYQHQTSNILVEAEAKVVYVFPVIKHRELNFQEFRVELTNGHRVRIIHDLNEAEAVPLRASDVIRFRGEFDWSDDGGLIHWTHDDPKGERGDGWIEFGGSRYL
jgi:hypothetical protein